MIGDRQHLIRKRAYEIWEQEGYPQGQHERHWDQATRDVDAQEGSQDASATDAELAAGAMAAGAGEAESPTLPDGLVGSTPPELSAPTNGTQPKRARKSPAPGGGSDQRLAGVRP